MSHTCDDPNCACKSTEMFTTDAEVKEELTKRARELTASFREHRIPLMIHVVWALRDKGNGHDVKEYGAHACVIPAMRGTSQIKLLALLSKHKELSDLVLSLLTDLRDAQTDINGLDISSLVN